jgi:hypothetical protein
MPTRGGWWRGKTAGQGRIVDRDLVVGSKFVFEG